MWQCLQWTIFSTTKKINIPPNTDIDNSNVNPAFSAASGSKWKNASPNNAPAEKLTRYMRIFFSRSCFTESVTIPISETMLTSATDAKAYSQTISMHEKGTWSYLNIREKTACLQHNLPFLHGVQHKRCIRALNKLIGLDLLEKRVH